jgi:hypothetical protein
MRIRAVTVETAAIEATTIRAITEVAATVVISVPPIGAVRDVSIPRISVVGIVIARGVNDGDGNGESKGKANAGSCRRFREERQSSDRKSEDNELLHDSKDGEIQHRVTGNCQKRPMERLQVLPPGFGCR